jgi:hypothetical protein
MCGGECGQRRSLADDPVVMTTPLLWIDLDLSKARSSPFDRHFIRAFDSERAAASMPLMTS